MKIKCPMCGKTLARLDLEDTGVKMEYIITCDVCETHVCDTENMDDSDTTSDYINTRINRHLETDSKVQTEKLLTFSSLFNRLPGQGDQNVEEENFIKLVKTGKFTEDEAKEFIRKGQQNGMMYERRPGFLNRA